MNKIFLSGQEKMVDFVPDFWKPFFGGAPLISTGVPVQTPQEVSTGNLVNMSQGIIEGNIIKKVTPEYPPLAKAARLQGVVVLQAVIGKNGVIQKLAVQKPLGLGVDESTRDAVSGWRYKPYLLNGEPVEVDTFITVNYNLR